MVAKIIESSAVGSETVREKSGRQGKLITKGHKCNKARIPTNAFYLSAWKAATSDTEIMITCDTWSSIADLECISVGDFIMAEMLSIRRKAK